MLKYLLEKEFKQFFRNPFLPKLVCAIPIVMIAILPFVVTMDVKNVKVCIVDNDNTTASERLISKIAASNYFKLNNKATTYKQGLSYVEDGYSDAVLSIPRGFEEKLMAGEGADVLIAANATDATKGSIGGSYLTTIVNDFASDFAVERGATIKAPPIEVLNVFNRRMNYRNFILPAMMGMLMILLGCAIPALAIVTEKENGTLEQINVTPVSKLQFILGKLIPYIVMGFVALTIALFFSWMFFNFVPVGSYAVIYAAALLMIIAMAGLGIIVSNYSDSIQQAIFLMFFIIIISILMSGLFTPVTSMPKWAQFFAGFMPPRYFMEIMRAVFLKGSGFVHLGKQFAALGGFVIFFCTFAVVSYRKKN